MTSSLQNQLSILEQEDVLMQEASDSDFLFRKLERTDYDSGYLETLAQLTKVGEISREDFLIRYSQMFPTRSDMYKIIVIQDKTTDKVIGSGSLILELKFIRQLGKVGHIEDIVVDSEYRGRRLGYRLIQLLQKISLLNDCYKSILDCN